jgi:hypothetical protein
MVIGVSCKPKHTDAKNIKRTEPELNVPGPSPEASKSSDARLDWCMEVTSDGYNKAGSRNPKWDGAAREALQRFAQVRAYGPDIEGFAHLLRYHVSRAIELGCDDPLIKYLQVRFVTDMSRLSKEQIADLYTGASDQLESSGYADNVKFYAAARADGALKALKPFPNDRARMYEERASDHLNACLKDKRMPVAEMDAAGFAYLEVIKHWSDEKERFDKMHELLMKNWPKQGVTYLLEGQFYVDYAWKGRSTKYAKDVTQEQWKLFFERLEVAEKLLTKGMEIDPKEGRLPALMIKVASGQQKGFSEMRKWFEKAMEVDPNNYTACDNLLYFLLPRWFGSRQAMIEFGRECASSEKWGGTVPLILADAHDTYNRFDGAPDGSYWKGKDVWPDIKTSFEKFFGRNPKAVSWRHNYARYAYWCEQWDTLNEQLDLMGDNINYEYFGGLDAFDKMVQLSRAHRRSAAK